MIRWITDRIGTAPISDYSPGTGFHLVDVRDLVDKPGNSPRVIQLKIEEAVKFLKQGGKIIICCDYGVSRSNAVAAGILASFSGISLSEAVRQVITSTGESAIKIEVISVIGAALGLEVNKLDFGNNSATRRMLVTGASGFIGSRLCKALEEHGHYVVAPKRTTIDLTKGAAELYLLIEDERIDSVIHLANPRITVNNAAMGEALVMIKNVSDACAQQRIPLYFLSDWEVFSGYSANQLLAHENLPLLPRGPYGETKYLCEVLLKICEHNTGLQHTTIRSSRVYGPGTDKPKFIYNFLDKARRDEDIFTHKYTNGFPSLDLLHIDDLITALVLIIEKRFVGAIHLGTGCSTSTANVAEQIIRLLGSKSKIYHREINKPFANITMDISLARATFDWHPKIDFLSGICQIVRDFALPGGPSI